MREISSWAVIEPRIGIAQRFITSMVVSPGARHAQCDGLDLREGRANPAKPVDDQQRHDEQATASTMPCSRSVQASASSPPKIV